MSQTPHSLTKAGNTVESRSAGMSRMLLEFSLLKNIAVEQRACPKQIRARAAKMGLKRYLITEQERDLLLKLRRDKGIIK